MTRDRIHFLFLNIGHYLDHLFTLIFATVAALALSADQGPLLARAPRASRVVGGALLLGFFVVECASLEQAIETAKDLGRASSSNGAYEIRPLMLYRPGSLSG